MCARIDLGFSDERCATTTTTDDGRRRDFSGSLLAVSLLGNAFGADGGGGTLRLRKVSHSCGCFSINVRASECECVLAGLTQFADFRSERTSERTEFRRTHACIRSLYSDFEIEAIGLGCAVLCVCVLCAL